MGALLFIAFAGALVVSLIKLRNTRWIMLMTALAIAVFPYYNQATHNSCEGGCTMRIDLFFVAPIMLIMIALTIRMSWRVFTEKE